MTEIVQIGNIKVGGGSPLVLIAGPCVIENESLVLDTAERLKSIAADADIPLVFKSSYDKANRSSAASFRGPGLSEGLRVLSRVRDQFQLPLLSDVHTVDEIGPAAEVLDVLQIPAFLCRQTDFLQAAARTGRVVNVKKGQFMAPWDMANIVEKIRETGNGKIMLTERGASFGYNALVADMRSLFWIR